MISGVRGSPVGGNPGLLYIILSEGPAKISPIPAMLLASGNAGDVASSTATARGVFAESASQSSATSSSVGPIALFSEGARYRLRIVAGSLGDPFGI